MDIYYERCAGLDVHKKTVVACVRVPGKEKRKRGGETRTFSTTTGGLLELSDWLESYGVTHVAMESTGFIGARCMRFWKIALSCYWSMRGT